MCLLVTSCSIPVTVNLFNNTGINQIVMIEGNTIEIGDGESGYIEGLEFSEFSIVSESEYRNYVTRSIPVSGIVWRGWGPFSKRLLYLQLESDGKIWVSKSKKKVANFGEQPEGFPISPQTHNNAMLRKAFATFCCGVATPLYPTTKLHKVFRK